MADRIRYCAPCKKRGVMREGERIMRDGVRQTLCGECARANVIDAREATRRLAWETMSEGVYIYAQRVGTAVARRTDGADASMLADRVLLAYERRIVDLLAHLPAHAVREALEGDAIPYGDATITRMDVARMAGKGLQADPREIVGMGDALRDGVVVRDRTRVEAPLASIASLPALGETILAILPANDAAALRAYSARDARYLSPNGRQAARLRRIAAEYVRVRDQLQRMERVRVRGDALPATVPAQDVRARYRNTDGAWVPYAPGCVHATAYGATAHGCTCPSARIMRDADRAARDATR